MGLPTTTANSSKHCYVSVLPVRGYRLIYNRFFRDQNLIAPLTVGTGDIPGSVDAYDASCQKAAKFSDYFTRSLPYAQKGAPVSIPLGTTAPVYGFPQSGNTVHLGDMITSGSSTVGGVSVINRFGSTDALGQTGHFDLAADLSGATAATINQLRFAFQYQKLLEKDSLYGTRLNAR